MSAPDLLDFASRIIIFQIEDDEEHVRLRFGRQDVITVKSSSAEGVALLKMEAERRAALAQPKNDREAMIKEQIVKIIKGHCTVKVQGENYAPRDGLDEAADKIAALAQPQNDWEAAGYAERLAVSLWKRHYRNAAPQWEPMTGDLIGILTQIDNMIAGLAPQRDADITDPPDWLWWGKLDCKDVVTFGRWPKNGACWRYKLADIQPTEHDHPTAPPPSSRMREALEEATVSSCGPDITIQCNSHAVKGVILECLSRAGDNHAACTRDHTPNATTIAALEEIERDNHASDGRELTEKEQGCVETALFDSSEHLYDLHASDGKESEGPYPEGVTVADHIAHDMKHGHFPNRTTIERFLSERSSANNLPSDDLGTPLERIRTEAARMGPNDAEAIAAIRPDYVSDLARELASGALEDLEGEDRAEDRVYYLARWFDAVCLALRGGD